MPGQMLRVKGYYDVMIHKNDSEDGYGLINLRLGGGTFKGFSTKISYLIPYLVPRTKSREQGF